MINLHLCIEPPKYLMVLYWMCDTIKAILKLGYVIRHVFISDNAEVYMHVLAKVTSYFLLLAIQNSLFCNFPFHLQEGDAALGNGGLARLSACQMDSLATLDYPVCGYKILIYIIKSEHFQNNTTN